MSKMVNWITENWKQFWVHGTYVYSKEEGIPNQSGMYVVVPIKLICEEYGITADDLMYGVVAE